jgi:hypothetical protein
MVGQEKEKNSESGLLIRRKEKTTRRPNSTKSMMDTSK